MENVVTVIFDVESEGYQAFSELRAQPFAEGYGVAEAALLKRTEEGIVMADAFDPAAVTADDTALGMMIGSIVGILGGPLGVLLGASTGALVGSTYDTVDAANSLSMLETTAAKLYDGEVAIIALVQEEEPAFDAAFEKYETTIIRHFAVDVMDEVDIARQVELDLARQAKAEMRKDRKDERAEKRAERKAAIQDKFNELKAKREAKREEFREAADIANAEFTSSTKEMLGTE